MNDKSTTYWKKILQSCLLGLLLLYTTTTAQAQSPGYQGKRFFAEYRFHYMPAFKGPTSKRKGPGFDGFGHNVRHTFSFNGIIGRKTSVFLNTDLYRTGLRVDQVVDGRRADGSSKPVQRLVFYKMKMRAYEFGISLHRLNKLHSLTPIGPHFDIGIRILRSKGKADGFWSEEDAQNTVSPTTTDGFDQTATNGLLTIGLANRHIWYDRITFTYGLRSSLALVSPSRLSKTDPGGKVTNYEFSYYEAEAAAEANKIAFKKMASLKAQQYHYIQLYVGVGFLLY